MELPYYYNIMDVFVLPSEEDPSPKVINEAMGFGLPVIGTNKVGTIFDMIVNTGSGFMVKVGDIEDIASKITKIASDRNLEKTLKKRSLGVVSQWSYENDINGFLEALQFISAKRR
jgi:glycosyltransferase involved in cell wall biosynthesis